MTIAYEPVGDEFQVNTTMANDQAQPAISALPGGGFVIVWASYGQDGSSDGVFAQRYAADGTLIGGEFQVNTYATLRQAEPTVAALADGGFVVIWTSTGQDGSGYGVFAQRYAADGTPIGGEFQVNTYTSSDQYLPTVAGLPDGGFIVIWQSIGQDGSDSGVYAQLYDPNGSRVGGEFQVNTYTASSQFEPAVAALADGGFVISWTSLGQDGSSYGVYAQRYDASGATAGGEFQVNTYTASYQFEPAVAALADGGFVVSWSSHGPDGSSFGIFAQRYAADGTPIGGGFQVNTYTSSDQAQPTVAALPDGGFVISWMSWNQDGSGFGIYAQRYDATGNAEGVEFRVNTTTGSFQAYPTITSVADGGFVVSWMSLFQDGSGFGIFAQQYSGGDTIPPDAPTIAQTSGPSDTTPHLEGTAEAGSTITIYDAGGNVVATGILVDGNGDWSHELGELKDGDYLYSATATDAAGNESASASTAVSIIVAGITESAGNGDDVIYGTDGRDTLNGENGNDTIHGGWAPDQLFGGNGADSLFGDEGDDLLYGDNGSDTLDGGSGNDTLDGGRDDDMLTGGSGDDQFVIGKTSGNDTITDFEEGADSLVLNDGLTVSSLQHSGDDTIVHLSNGATVTLLGVTLTDVDDLYSPAAELALATSNSDALIV